MREHHLPVDGCRLFVREDGPRSGTPLLLLHSLFFDGRMFDALCAALDARCGPCRIIRPDHRGQGRSLPTALAPEMDRLAEDTIAVLERLDSGPVHLVGSSMGAYVGMRVLLRRPDLVSSAALLCCTAGPERDPSRFLALVDDIRRETPAGLTGVIARTMFGDVFLSNPEDAAERRRWMDHFASVPSSVAEAAQSMFTRQGLERDMAGLERPLLLFAGELDRAKRPADMAALADLAPGSRLVVLPGVGHTPVIEAPGRVAEELAAWWRNPAPPVIHQGSET